MEGVVFDWSIIAAAIFGLLVLYFLSRIFFRPLRHLFRLLAQTMAGGAVLALFNLVGANFGLTVGLNPVSALVVGIMGLPGLGMLVGLSFIFR